ncbi:hypothetical protein OHS33_38900 (plasmid) [Streptomyces sp. NBC_00536]|uniref:hypothetical protein n=1 Tax=Streptomyces sp. NBC_00536 TaxID=2975769 RepID=UPI002E7FD92F|nr:hypothetical protein [Streptomyces sp. NBC_00536]WUC84327.1 hypothetical protein OHS33_38900 [Streptomyces sp. NBC_00536]
MSGVTPERDALRSHLEQLFEMAYGPILGLLTGRTGNPEKAANLTERVFVAAALEGTIRTTEQWSSWLYEAAGRVYDEDFLESCGIRP